MGTQKNERHSLIGDHPENFVLKEMVEVFRKDAQGNIIESMNFLEDERIAEGLIQIYRNVKDYHTRKVWVVTDGKNGFLLGESIVIEQDEKVKKHLARHALSKLNKHDRFMLDLPE
ncbi:MAG: hypothetical protein KAJ58_02170 [Candidatus Pacebacteria bacterium]|nr:hypothetical protein [Candidatus Paceibacterota bacterium]